MSAALGAGVANGHDAPGTQPLAAGARGFQERHGDEIIVCGRPYRIGTRVVLWSDEGGYDAYRTSRRFVPFERSDWKNTLAEMRAGGLTFAASETQETSPDRYDLRFGSAVDTAFTPEQLEQVRGGGWPLPLLQEKIDQFVLHYDVCGTSAQCFYILHDVRGLSVHFLLDVDGTIYQTLDLKERARHATKSNDRSIGVEIANIGAYPVGEDNPFEKWYAADGSAARLIFPPGVRGRERFAEKTLRPRHAAPVTGTIRGTEYVQYDYTPEQYAALAKLAAALCDIFPRLRPEMPRAHADAGRRGMGRVRRDPRALSRTAEQRRSRAGPRLGSPAGRGQKVPRGDSAPLKLRRFWSCLDMAHPGDLDRADLPWRP